MHDKEAPWNLSLGLSPLAIRHRRMTDAFVKKSAERSETLKAYFETDIGHAEFVTAEQFFRFLNASFDEVLVRRLIECLPEETEKMIA